MLYKEIFKDFLTIAVESRIFRVVRMLRMVFSILFTSSSLFNSSVCDLNPSIGIKEFAIFLHSGHS